MGRGSRGTTVLEVLIGTAILAALVAACYGVMNLLFSTRSRHSLTSMTRRSFVQKDARAGFRRLIYRLRESIQVIDPAPGTGGPTLTFRDITNQKIRIRLDGSQSRVLSEKEVAGTWAVETAPTLVQAGADALPASWPVAMLNCTAIHFSVLSPECVSVVATLVSEGQSGSYMTVIKLRNANVNL
ncbi:MAG: hypothetical protein HY815_19405 [Candidatus Riflebacteria bacterium]|nr:hypothetical protein [Candidatus Riflebacteria bacterium]